jgi:hypothetical protein
VKKYKRVGVEGDQKIGAPRKEIRLKPNSFADETRGG